MDKFQLRFSLDGLRKIKTRLLNITGALFFQLSRILPQSHRTTLFTKLHIRLWKLTGMNVSHPVFIDSNFKYINPRNITIGSYVSLGHDNHIWAFNQVNIGRYTQTAKDLLIIAGSHDTGSLTPLNNQQVNIGEGCWIGARATIIGGVTIGKGVIIGACSLVNKDIPDFAIAVGNPAVVVKFRTPDEIQWNPFGSFKISELQ